MSKLKRLLMVAGRYQAENPYNELCLKKKIENRGVKVVFALPGRKLNAAGFPDSMRQDPIFKGEGSVWLNNEKDFCHQMRGNDAVLFGSWKGHRRLADLAHREGRLTFDFSGLVGLDHFFVGHDLSFVKSPMTKRFLLASPRTMGWPEVPPERIVITGSIQFEQTPESVLNQIRDRETFCRYYGMDPQRPIAVLFPKAIFGFRKKSQLWYPEWSPEQVDSYNQWFLDKYNEISKIVIDAGLNFMVKLHPSSYAAYWCKEGEEYTYWDQYPWIKLLVPEHTLAMFHHMDVGLGINTSAVMDTGYFRKPFICVDSDQIPIPPILSKSCSENHFCNLTPGPSSHWHSTPLVDVNQWVPCWLGYFAKAHELPSLLSNPTTFEVNEKDWMDFIAEFWHKNDGNTSERVADFIERYCDQKLGSWKRWASLRHLRGLVLDTLHYLRFGKNNNTGCSPFHKPLL